MSVQYSSVPPHDIHAPSKRRNIRRSPYRQGGLDGLCGVYSVVNAICHAVSDGQNVGREFAEGMFVHLINELDAAGLVASALVEGIRTRRRDGLLRSAVGWAQEHLGIRLAVQRPFGSQQPVSVVADSLEAHLELPGTSALVGVGYGRVMTHWTCIAAVERPRLIALDSAGYRHFWPRLDRPNDSRNLHPFANSLRLIAVHHQHQS